MLLNALQGKILCWHDKNRTTNNTHLFQVYIVTFQPYLVAILHPRRMHDDDVVFQGALEDVSLLTSCKSAKADLIFSASRFQSQQVSYSVSQVVERLCSQFDSSFEQRHLLRDLNSRQHIDAVDTHLVAYTCRTENNSTKGSRHTHVYEAILLFRVEPRVMMS